MMEQLEAVWNFFIQWYWIPLSIFYLAIILTILIENRNPEKTIAWILVIVFLPVVGIVLYYFFGQQFKKDHFFSALDQKFAQRINVAWNRWRAQMEEDLRNIEAHSPRLVDVFEYLTHTKNALPTTQNEVSLLINGEEKFSSLLQDIQNAQHHIHLEYYIFDEDALGQVFLDALVAKAKEGVEIRVLIDGFGASRLAKKQAYYQSLGIELALFFPVKFSSLANSNYRNHRKIVVVDGGIGYVGGINISKKYDNRYANQRYWRDTALRIKGEAVKNLQLQFWLHWELMSQKPFVLSEHYVPKQLLTAQRVPVSFAFSSPGLTIPYVMEAMITSLLSAQQTITLCTPYFIPTNEYKSALLIAVSKGVRVQLMLPEKGDSAIVHYASLSFLKPFMERGVEVFLYQKGFLHAKTICVDQALTFVGTTNLDTRSFLINFECNAVVLDTEMAAQHNQQFALDQADSVRLTSAQWQQEKWYIKAFASVCRLLAPLL